jgi:hypothetical protein
MSPSLSLSASASAHAFAAAFAAPAAACGRLAIAASPMKQRGRPWDGLLSDGVLARTVADAAAALREPQVVVFAASMAAQPVADRSLLDPANALAAELGDRISGADCVRAVDGLHAERRKVIPRATNIPGRRNRSLSVTPPAVAAVLPFVPAHGCVAA